MTFLKNLISNLSTKLKKLYAYFLSLKILYRILLFILIIGAFFAYKMLFGKAYPMEIKTVEVHIAKKENLLSTTKLLGIIGAKKIYIAKAGYSGTLEFIAESGAKLKKNDIIAYINLDEVNDAYNSALKSAQIADEQYKREVTLEKKKASSKQSVEQKFIQLSQAQNNLAAAKMNLDKILFLAPFDGIVATPLFYKGSQVNLGDEIVTFYDDSELIVKFDIAGNIARKLPAKAIVTIDGKEFETYSIPKILPKNSYAIPAYLDYKCENCMIGDITEVDLHIIDKKDIITLPSSCIFLKDGKSMVYKVIDNKAMLEEVEVGIEHEDIVEITQGVKESDVIILEGQGRLYPEVMVKIYNQEKL